MQTELCRLAEKYGTDKCPKLGHNYTPVYYDLLKGRDIKKVLEIGVYNGASLRMWRDFFPGSRVYGADIDPKTMFSEDRIETSLCDQYSLEDLNNLISFTGTDIDLVIDDGSHETKHQIYTAWILLPMLKSGCTYIIEDSRDPVEIVRTLNMYKCDVYKFSPKHKQDTLVVIRK